MKQGFVQSFRVTLLCLIGLLLLGCKVELYSGLDEREGNEMLAILLDNDIPSEKLVDKDKIVTIMVEGVDVARSVRVLSSLGFPKEKYSSIGDIFPKDGLISSPTEERARYTYSMSQELSSTLSMIDGVVTARVHVVLPQEQDSLTDVNYPSSASVFIKYTPELELAGLVPKVKTLVANSIEGLSLEKIAVSLFPATRLNSGNFDRPSTETVLFVDVNSDSAGVVRLVVYALILLLVVALGVGGYFFWMMEQKKKKKKKKDNR
ncbi:type III secretion system inner membrane ring lipoprotein SctJ [Endozoicomonas sp. SCSIO W0465]|uniref:type III secretion system inner membrane ring lipoprotein SctJ n=1 Tax=Endozoicomonas sp. SCSIO W0465 TaxID=2918516 RepID=UPI0020764F54|nr:type III secretion inner membrane ring lipoprotein SctJ [Endozoicomonas sp. SCSIO W0465]USE35272.1 type III secretion inner membrane ring lipoprotein SctJ [Endozoicomonas sp. SCSIO W0465]